MKLLKILGVIAGLSVLILLEMLLTGWVISVLWVWFIVATFNIAALTVPQSIGIALLVGYLTKEYNTSKNTEMDNVSVDDKGELKFTEYKTTAMQGIIAHQMAELELIYGPSYSRRCYGKAPTSSKRFGRRGQLKCYHSLP